MSDDEPELSQAELVAESKRIIEELRPMFYAMDPRVAGAVLGQLLALYFAGHNPRTIRRSTKKAFYLMVDHMVALMDGRSASPWKRPTPWWLDWTLHFAVGHVYLVPIILFRWKWGAPPPWRRG